jgi:hypothetical protein
MKEKEEKNKKKVFFSSDICSHQKPKDVDERMGN